MRCSCSRRVTAWRQARRQPRRLRCRATRTSTWRGGRPDAPARPRPTCGHDSRRPRSRGPERTGRRPGRTAPLGDSRRRSWLPRYAVMWWPIVIDAFIDLGDRVAAAPTCAAGIGRAIAISSTFVPASSTLQGRLAGLAGDTDTRPPPARGSHRHGRAARAAAVASRPAPSARPPARPGRRSSPRSRTTSTRHSACSTPPEPGRSSTGWTTI